MQTNINPVEWQKLYDGVALHDAPRFSTVSFESEPGYFWYFWKVEGEYAYLYRLEDINLKQVFYAAAWDRVMLWTKVDGK